MGVRSRHSRTVALRERVEEDAAHVYISSHLRIPAITQRCSIQVDRAATRPTASSSFACGWRQRHERHLTFVGLQRRCIVLLVRTVRAGPPRSRRVLAGTGVPRYVATDLRITAPFGDSGHWRTPASAPSGQAGKRARGQEGKRCSVDRRRTCAITRITARLTRDLLGSRSTCNCGR